ncbi:hypothetical protein GR183_08405 [Stappia sp. GBMRC 2046]|uniref:Uncharacterized protein n=1 Tax=Stappia sediminis TaxID=2692190 RepID=A0A7X3LTQ5_9HYPH|nr:hypothetical protein [Stappia sediminis]MXN64927.1 hypothetical protein [Stappia sediminis]
MRELTDKAVIAFENLVTEFNNESFKKPVHFLAAAEENPNFRKSMNALGCLVWLQGVARQFIEQGRSRDRQHRK